MSGAPRRPATEATLTIAPDLRSSMCGSTAWVRCTIESRLSRNVFSHPEKRIVASGMENELPPALLTRMSRCPSDSVAAATARRTASASVTSQGSTTARRPCASTAAAT